MPAKSWDRMTPEFPRAFISMPDEESMCYVSMVTFADEAEANNMYRSNCELVKGNIIGNDGYSYQMEIRKIIKENDESGDRIRSF